jgi:predicted enzyme related to lactoylglutathione lyase
MNYQLEHVAIYTKDVDASIKFYEKFFGGHATPIRRGAAGYGFCFVRIAGAPSIQLMESATQVGVHHYGYVTDDVEQVAKEFKEKGAEILRENRDDTGKLTTILSKIPTAWSWKSERRANGVFCAPFSHPPEIHSSCLVSDRRKDASERCFCPNSRQTPA